ncbi:MAG: hypothetical protein AAFP28_12755 [Pseudomonadota bacterium]
MLAAALVINIAVLIPVCSGLLRQAPAMEALYGPDQDSRRIMTALYLAIGVGSAVLLAGLAIGAPVTGAIVCLLALQIFYNCLTGVMVGTHNVAIRWNLGIAAFHTAAVASLAL